MPDSAQLAVTEPEEDAVQLATPAREVERKDFVETFIVRDHGKRYEVAANAIANRAMMQVTVAKLYSLCERTMKPFMDDPELVPSPKELKIMVEAFSVVSDMSNAAYGDTKKGGGMANALERLAYGMTRGAVEAGRKASLSPEARLNRLKQVGKGECDPVDAIPEV